MIRVKLITCGIASTLFLISCTRILEPVSLFSNKQDSQAESSQEDFKINIKSLTFNSALNANKALYPRQLMLNGGGSDANVFNEADFLISSIPPILPTTDYTLGVGDKLLYTQLNEFAVSNSPILIETAKPEYLLGVGDELTLIQLTEIGSGLSNITTANNSINNRNAIKSLPSESILKTSAIVGTDGNILLLGLGRIKAKNRSLKSIQTEVRNIIIRNGLAPSFQLEISGFNSKKAFVTFPKLGNVNGKNVVPITNLPITLKELVVNYGVQPTSQNTVVVALKRMDQTYRLSLKKLFGKSSLNIIIQDNDHITIEEVSEDPVSIELVVGSRGKILIPKVGSFIAKNRSLSELQKDISRVLVKNRLVPNFQLEIIDYKSKSFFLITKKHDSKKIALNNSKLSLKEAILSNITSYDTNSNSSLTIVNLFRNNHSYNINLHDALRGSAAKIVIQDKDLIEMKSFDYKLGKVFALSGAGNAHMVPISPSKRETLADILFTPKGALNNLLAKRSEVYLLRGRNPSIAYHLDAQNVSRILVAAKTELRPNDILYVADRPIISFSRTLSEILPLRSLLRDIDNGNIP